MKRILILSLLFCSLASIAQPAKKLPPPFDKKLSAYTKQGIRDSLFKLGTNLSYSHDTINAASITDTLITRDTVVQIDTIVVGGKQIFCGRNSAAFGANATAYTQLNANANSTNTDPTDTANGAQYYTTLTPISGTFRNARATHYAVVNADTVTFTLFKNGAATAITFFITGDTKVGGDNTHTVSASVDDLFAWRVVSTAGVSFKGAYSIEFDPD